MNVTFRSFVNTFSFNLENSLQEASFGQKISIIALAAINLIALTYLFYTQYYKADRTEEKKEGSPKEIKSESSLIEHKESPKIAKDQEIDFGSGKKYIYYQNKVLEKGPFLEGKLNGIGKRIYPVGMGEIEKLKGEFKKGELNGDGKATYFDGRVFTGKFVDGRLVQGDKKYPRDKGYTMLLERGTFVDDQLTGKGEVEFTDGIIHKGDHFEKGLLKINIFMRRWGWGDDKTELYKVVYCNTIATIKEREKVSNLHFYLGGKPVDENKTFEEAGIKEGMTLDVSSK